MDFKLNYDELIILDAEDLAEGGIAEAYESLLPKLREYVPEPAAIEEVMDNDEPSYVLRYAGKEFAVYNAETQAKDEAAESWDRATHALFEIVNDQLANSDYRFFAINGGNDLGGIFLTPAQAEACRKYLPRKQDWPYLPTDEGPWYGQYH